MTKQEIKNEVNLMFSNGVNKIKVTEMIERFVKKSEKEVRHRSAEIVAGANSKDDAMQEIMNIRVFR